MYLVLRAADRQDSSVHLTLCLLICFDTDGMINDALSHECDTASLLSRLSQPNVCRQSNTASRQHIVCALMSLVICQREYKVPSGYAVNHAIVTPNIYARMQRGNRRSNPSAHAIVTYGTSVPHQLS